MLAFNNVTKKFKKIWIICLLSLCILWKNSKYTKQKQANNSEVFELFRYIIEKQAFFFKMYD